MKVLIIGGTGFIGSNIVEQLVNENYDVSVITRGRSESLLKNEDKVEKLTGNRNDISFMKTVADKNFDVVIDMTSFNGEDSRSMINLFEGKTGRFIHTSTVSVYMVSDNIQCPVTEDQDKGALMDFWPMNPFGMQYGIDKRKCEDVLWKAYHENNFPVTMVRPSYVCGPHDPAKRDFFWIERIMDGKPLLIPGSGDYATQSVYVEDLAKAYVELLKNDKTIGQAYNVASEEIYSLNDYLDKLSYLLGNNPERVDVDLNIFENLPFSTSTEGHAFPFNTYKTAVFSLDKIKNDTGYKSTRFEDWMPETIEWYLNESVGHSVGYGRRDDEVNFIKSFRQKHREFINTVKEIWENKK